MKRLSVAVLAVVCAATPMFCADIAPMSVVYVDGAVEASLTGVAGDAANGRAVFADRKLGNCLACHENADWDEQPFHGEVGPILDGVALRWSEAELRGIVANSKVMFEGSIMPAFYVDAGFERTLEKFEGKSILSAQQVEDVVAYLMTLTEE